MTRRMLFLPFAVALLAAFFAPCTASAVEQPGQPAPSTRQARPDKDAFVRFTEDGKGGGTLETAIVTYGNAAGVEVSLIAAVHVGEKSYYRELSKTFDTYDALLYELVKPRDAAVPGAPTEEGPVGAPVRGAAVIGGLQSFLKNTLKLDFQLEAINYNRPNFVHADLDAETFNAMQEERGESIFGLMLRSMIQEMKRNRDGGGSTPITMFDLLAAMRSPDSARSYKMLLARQFEDMEVQLQGMEGPEGSVLLAERNKVAIKVLKSTIAKGKKSIGVFYGAGHMRGIEAALIGDMGFERKATEWRVAWDMRDASKPSTRPAAKKP